MSMKNEIINGLTPGKLDWLVKKYASVGQKRNLVTELASDGKINLKELKALDAMERAPKTTSANSSLPPSKDWKSNKSKSTGKKRRSGGQPGRKGKSRKLTENPDRVVDHYPEKCGNSKCSKPIDASKIAERNKKIVGEYDRAELADKPIITTRHNRFEVTCDCGCQTVADAPPAAYGSPYGPDLSALITLLKCDCNLGYKKTAELIEMLNFPISEGGVGNILKRAYNKAEKVSEEIREKLIKQLVISSDETGVRVDGQNYYQFVFRSDDLVVHRISPNRSRDVITVFLDGETPLVWVSDRYSGQQNIAENHQTCLAHLLRRAVKVLEHGDEEVGKKLIKWLKRAFAFHDNLSNYTKADREKRKVQLERDLAKVIFQPTSCQVTREVLVAFKNAYKDDQLLTFADFEPGMVPATNNRSEQSLRPSVICRKVINCFRKLKNAEGFVAVRSVLKTFTLSGKNKFEAMKAQFRS